MPGNQERVVEPHYRYPLSKWAAVLGAGLLFCIALFFGALFVMPLVPLIPVFVSIIIGVAGLLSSALSYARMVRVELPPAARARSTHETSSGKVLQAPRSAASLASSQPHASQARV